MTVVKVTVFRVWFRSWVRTEQRRRSRRIEKITQRGAS